MSDADIYFDRQNGLRAFELAEDINVAGPLAYGLDDIMWSYQDGVWVPDKHVVRKRAAWLLGDRYRHSYVASVEDVIRSLNGVPCITSEPVSEYINFRNGLYAWKADMLYPHTPDVLSTVQLTVDWDPNATCPLFDAFLTEVVEADMIGPMWELIGYAMYSGNPLHKAVMLLGGGRNGKGTFLRVLIALLGSRNITAVSLHDLVSVRFSTVSLFGKIANIAGDIDATYLENTATFKKITGEDMIRGEHKNRDPFDFTAWALPMFSANKVPPSSDVTTGYLSRWFVVRFPNDFSGKEDRQLTAKLATKTELQGIAAKAMPYLRRLMARGDFALPDSGREAQADFARRVDQVRTWVHECCTIGSEYPAISRTVLYRAYKAWAKRDNHKPVRASEFYDRLDAIGGPIEATRIGNGERVYKGIKITDTAEEHPEAGIWR